MRLSRSFLCLCLFVVFALTAQEPKPSCSHCSASYVPASELKAYLDRGPERAVPRDSAYQIGNPEDEDERVGGGRCPEQEGYPLIS